MESEGGSPTTPDTVCLDEPFTPKSTARHRGDFARLIPVNDGAKRALHDIIVEMRKDEDWNRHCRQFIHDDRSQSHIGDTLEDSEVEGTASNVTEAVWTGYYKLNLEIPVLSVGLGIVLGGGRADLVNGGVDLLLTLKPKEDHVRARHARLNQHYSTGVLMLFVDKNKKVIVNGVDTITNEQRHIGHMSTSLTFGHLMYELQFTGLSDQRYREQLSRRYTPTQSYGIEPIKSMSVTPSAANFEYHGYMIQGQKIGQGAEGVVSAGVDMRTGDCVAIKRLQRNHKNHVRIQAEVAIFRRIGKHPNLCELLAARDVGDDAGTRGSLDFNDYYLIYKPLASFDFHYLSKGPEDYQTRRSCFEQAIRGVERLHSLGIMHRDIKPSNLMVVSLEPLRVVVIDYGCGTLMKLSSDHMSGTLEYLAPEVWNLKCKNPTNSLDSPNVHSEDMYDSSVDVWSLGLSGYQLFFPTSNSWKGELTRAKHSEILRVLASRPNDDVMHLVKEMIAWNRGKRPKAHEILSRTLWSI